MAWRSSPLLARDAAVILSPTSSVARAVHFLGVDVLLPRVVLERVIFIYMCVSIVI